MPPRRLGAHLGRGVVACALVATLAACSPEEVQVSSPELSAEDTEACASLVDALPDTLAGELRRPVDPDDALGAAWGDPAYVLTCGVSKPKSYTRDAPCNDMLGVGWFVPEDQLADLRVEATAFALTHEPYVELVVPPRHRNDGVDRALADLAPIIKEHLTVGEPCL